MAYRKYPEAAQSSRFILDGKSLVYCYHCIPTGMKYVGVTSSLARWSNHHLSSPTKQSPFYDAVRKHGWDNFTFGVVEVFDDVTKRRIKEQHWIDSLNTQTNGYNYSHTPEHIGKTTPNPTFIVEFASGDKQRVTNLKQWCNDNGYSWTSLWRLKNGTYKQTSHRGITRVEKL